MTQINVTELAEKLDTTPRQARKFLRSVTPVENQPGKGGRWAIEAKQVRSLTKKFAEFQAEHTRPEPEQHDEEADSE